MSAVANRRSAPRALSRWLVPILGLTTGLTLPVESREAVPEAVARAADAYARDVAGVLLYRTKLESRIASPVFNRHSTMEAWGVMKDGVPVRTRIVSLRNDGKDVSKDEMAKQEAKTNASYQEGKVHLKPPYDRRYMKDYAFNVDADKEASGMVQVTFTSAIADEQHGSGSFTLDGDYRVRRLQFKPNVFPKNVDKGAFSLERRDVGGGIFGLHRLELSYQGSLGFLKGGMDLTQVYQDYSRFKSLDEALSSLSAR